MGMIDCINRFVDTMINEKSQFENMKSEVSQRENNVAELLDALEQKEKEIIDGLKVQIAESKDETIQEIFKKTSESLFLTMSEADKKIKEAIKGMTFIHDFESHFVVSVFGKVKAGKSYIGNFIMGQPLRENKIASSYDKLEDLKVTVYDRGKQYEQNKLSTLEEERECNGKEFYVNKSEATSTIQWVNIGGMCWFDTPGIGSVTIENELLAKEYVKNSDLVIFACNSDAAGTRQEFSEIRHLHEMEKPILLLLTQSDMYDYDVDEEDNEIAILIPKSEKDRSDQEQYMLDTLREQGMEDVLKYANILTVSALLATEALKNGDEEQFEKSNMGKLIKKLTEITKNDAAKMKRNTPKDRINEVIESVIKDLNTINTEIFSGCDKIKHSKEKFIKRKNWIVENIKANVRMKILEIVAKAKAKVEHNSSSVVSEEQLSDEINVAITEIVHKICLEESIINTENIPDLNIELTGIGDMKMKQDKISYEYVNVRRVQRPPKGLLEKVGEFFFDKKYYTSKSSKETRYSTFDIGVNDNEIANNIILQLNTDFSSTVDDYINYLIEGYYEPVEVLQQKTTAEIVNTIKKLEEMRM